MTKELDNIGKLALYIGHTTTEHAKVNGYGPSDLLEAMAMAYVTMAMSFKSNSVDPEQLRPDLLGAVEDVINTMVEALHEEA